MISPSAWRQLLKDAVVAYEVKTRTKQPITNLSIDKMQSAKFMMDVDTNFRTNGKVTGAKVI